jgi:hypothetical protein
MTHTHQTSVCPFYGSRKLITIRVPNEKQTN